MLYFYCYLVVSELDAWRQLVQRCQTNDDAPLEFVRPIRGLGSEFLGKRSPADPNKWMACPFDNDQLCLCIKKEMDDQLLPSSRDYYQTAEKRGLGAILLSGTRMTNYKWPGLNGLQRRQMGSEFLGKRAVKNGGAGGGTHHEFPGKKASSSRTGSMGNEFLGKRSAGETFNDYTDDIEASHQQF